jgi:hypothetical protein
LTRDGVSFANPPQQWVQRVCHERAFGVSREARSLANAERAAERTACIDDALAHADDVVLE